MKKFALITVIFIWGVLTAQQVLAGVYYKATMRSGKPDGAGKEVMQVSVWLEGEKARVEWGVSKAGMPPAYSLTVDGGETIYQVNGEMYMRLEGAALREAGMQMFGGDGEGGALNIKVTELSSEKLLHEPGEPLLGRETTHYRFRSSSVNEIKILGMRQRSKITTVEEIWTTPSIPNHGFGAIVKLPFSARVAMGDAEGFVLKTVTEMTTVGKRGRSKTDRTVVTVDELREGPIAPDRFDLEAVLKLQEMPSFTTPPPGGGGGGNPLGALLGGRRRGSGGP